MPGDILEEITAYTERKPEIYALRDHAALALMTAFGARAGDIARLQLSDVDLKGMRIHWIVKGSKPGELPLPEETAKIVSDYMDLRRTLEPDPPHHSLFVSIRLAPGQRYQPWTAQSISQMVRRMTKKFGGSFGVHSIRHWRGQSLADARVPPTIAQAILMHEDVRTTLEYYSDQDWDRLTKILTEFEKPSKKSQPDPLKPEASGPNNHASDGKIIHLLGRTS
jgi:integrase